MTLEISISAAIAIAITARLMYLLYLNGKTISSVSFTGRAVALLRASLFEFTDGWRERKWGYLFIAYPSMLAAMGLTSLGIYAIIPILGHSAGFWDQFRYCVLIILASVPLCLLGAFIIIYGVYLLKVMLRTWWRRKDSASLPDNAPAQPPPSGMAPPESAASIKNEKTDPRTMEVQK